MKNNQSIILWVLTATFLFFWGTLGVTAESTSAQVSGPVKEMNGYRLEQFGDFAKNWHFVTVRFRKDTNEMRFVYANDLAWDTMSQGKTDYPDGATLAKIGIATKDDPLFANSAAPSGTRRIQFMVRNAKKHAETDGWGYALFDVDGHVFPGDEHTESMACTACHRLAKSRGEVFAEPASLPSFSNLSFASVPAPSEPKPWQNTMTYETQPISKLPKKLQVLLPGSVKSIRVMTGALVKHLFSGTLDEVRPLLAQEAARTNVPAALIADNQTLFSVVIPENNPERCSGQMAMRGLHTLPDPNKPLFELLFCTEKSNHQ